MGGDLPKVPENDSNDKGRVRRRIGSAGKAARVVEADDKTFVFVKERGAGAQVAAVMRDPGQIPELRGRSRGQAVVHAETDLLDVVGQIGLRALVHENIPAAYPERLRAQRKARGVSGRRQRVSVELSVDTGRHERVRREDDAADVVGALRVEAGPGQKRRLALQPTALAEEDTAAPAGIADGRRVDAVADALAALDAVVSVESAQAEQIGGIEVDRTAVLVRIPRLHAVNRGRGGEHGGLHDGANIAVTPGERPSPPDAKLR